MKIKMSLLLCSLGSSILFGQGLVLRNGDKSVKLDSNEPISISLSLNTSEDCKSCSVTTYHGRVTKISTDSISLEATMKKSFARKARRLVYVEHIYEGYNKFDSDIRIPKKSIFSVEVLGDRSKQKGRRSRTGIGGLLIGTGLTTLLTAAVLSENNQRGTIALIGGGEIVLGTAFILSGKSKKFEKHDGWLVD